MSGCNQSYLRSILMEFKFDENMRGYAFGEDLDFSVQVDQKYPLSLIITPRARITHRAWQAGPNLSQEQTLMQFVYPRYLFYKFGSDDRKNQTLFSWSELGRLLLLALMVGGNRLANLRNAMASFIFCRRHLKDLRKQKLDFLDRILDPDKFT